MPAAGIVLLTVLASVYVAFADLRRAFVCLLLVVMLVPDTLVVPNGLTAYLSVLRVVTIAFLIGLVGRRMRGEIPAGVFRPTRVHLVFLAFLAVALGNGVGLAEPTITTTESMLTWAQLADQLVFLVAVLAAVRAIGDDWWLARVIAGVLVASCVVAIGEHFLKGSWSRWFFASQPKVIGSDAARGLTARGGQLRVKAAAQFALAFAWVSAMLFPILLVVVSRARRFVLLALLLPVGVVAAIFWSFTRSAMAGVGLGLLILWLGSRFDRRIGLLAGVAGLVATLALLFAPTLTAPYKGQTQQASIDVRLQRLPTIFQLVADHPYRGLGLGGLRQQGLHATDNSYLRFYGDLGVVGLVAFLVLIAVVLVETAAAVRGPPGPSQLVGAAAFTGIVLGVLGANASSHFTIPGSALPIWTLVALAMAIGERQRGFVPALPRLTIRRAAVPVVALAAGLVLAAAGPVSATSRYGFQTLHVQVEALAQSQPGFIGHIFVVTACGLAERAAEDLPGVQVRCRSEVVGDGLGDIEVRAPDRLALGLAERRVYQSLRSSLGVFHWQHLGVVEQGEATWTRTSSVWLGMVGGAGALLLGRRRRDYGGPVAGRPRILAVAG